MPPTRVAKKEDLKKQDDGPPDLAHYSDIIDHNTFEQILEMDDDEEERDFSKGIVYGFFEQAESTFEKMEKAFSKKDYGDLSQLGHFLKGSSATLGLIKVRDSCEKLQHCKEEILEKGEGAEREKADEDIQSIIKGVREDYKEVAALLRRFFGEEPAPDDEEHEAKSPKSEKK